MANTNLVGRCGLYCGACAVYRAYKDGGEYLKEFAEEAKCPLEKVRCEGCGALTAECWGNDCEIVQCSRSRGFEFCYQCDRYEDGSCEKFGKLAARYLKSGVDLRANLERIEKGAVEEWLRECEEKYKCPSCGKLLTIWARKEKCYHCNVNLSENHQRA